MWTTAGSKTTLTWRCGMRALYGYFIGLASLNFSLPSSHDKLFRVAVGLSVASHDRLLSVAFWLSQTTAWPTSRRCLPHLAVGIRERRARGRLAQCVFWWPQGVWSVGHRGGELPCMPYGMSPNRSMKKSKWHNFYVQRKPNSAPRDIYFVWNLYQHSKISSFTSYKI